MRERNEKRVLLANESPPPMDERASMGVSPGHTLIRTRAGASDEESEFETWLFGTP
jgi:hypothetical protein